MSYRIDRGIPLPPARRGGFSLGYTEAISSLSIGDSVWLDCSPGTASGLSHQVGKKLGRKFAYRPEKQTRADGSMLSAKITGYRIWRTA